MEWMQANLLSNASISFIVMIILFLVIRQQKKSKRFWEEKSKEAGDGFDRNLYKKFAKNKEIEIAPVEYMLKITKYILLGSLFLLILSVISISLASTLSYIFAASLIFILIRAIAIGKFSHNH